MERQRERQRKHVHMHSSSGGQSITHTCKTLSPLDAQRDAERPRTVLFAFAPIHVNRQIRGCVVSLLRRVRRSPPLVPSRRRASRCGRSKAERGKADVQGGGTDRQAPLLALRLLRVVVRELLQRPRSIPRGHRFDQFGPRVPPMYRNKSKSLGGEMFVLCTHLQQRMERRVMVAQHREHRRTARRQPCTSRPPPTPLPPALTRSSNPQRRPTHSGWQRPTRVIPASARENDRKTVSAAAG